MLKKRKKVKHMDEKEKELDNCIVVPNHGLLIGDKKLLFGLSIQEVNNIIGKADKEYKTDEENIRWQYNELFVELSFEKENNYTLGWIEVFNNRVVIFDNKIIGYTKKEILQLFDCNLSEKAEYEDYGSFETIFYAKHWIELQFQFNLLHNINFGK